MILLTAILIAMNLFHPAPMQVATYSTLCLEDYTEKPLEAAVEEFEGLVDVTIQNDCSEEPNWAIVVDKVRCEYWSGWYNSPKKNHATISINLTQEYRLDYHGWKQVLVHEIGHAIGLPHNRRGDSVMNPIKYKEHDGLTDYDLLTIGG